MACVVIDFAQYKATHRHGERNGLSVTFSGPVVTPLDVALLPYSALIALMNFNAALLAAVKPKED